MFYRLLKSLRAILSKSQAKKEMKIFDPLQILHAVRYSGGMHKNTLFEGCNFIVAMATPIVCWCLKTYFFFYSESVVKCAKCKALFLESIKTLTLKTWSKYKPIILVYFYV